MFQCFSVSVVPSGRRTRAEGVGKQPLLLPAKEIAVVERPAHRETGKELARDGADLGVAQLRLGHRYVGIALVGVPPLQHGTGDEVGEAPVANQLRL